jgi:hypothetical protein
MIPTFRFTVTRMKYDSVRVSVAVPRDATTYDTVGRLHLNRGLFDILRRLLEAGAQATGTYINFQ